MPADDPPVEHTAVLREPGDFDLLRRKDDLFEEGVSTVFGIRGEEAELQAICFDARRYTAEQAPGVAVAARAEALPIHEQIPFHGSTYR